MCCLFKYDRYHRGGDQGPSFQRLNLDIEHLDLSEYILFQISLYPLVTSFDPLFMYGLTSDIISLATVLPTYMFCIMYTKHCTHVMY